MAGITKIFKDKSKEDGDIVDEPEVKDKKKKDKKFRFGSKGQPATSSTSHATAEAMGEDRVIEGLSPAAQLARQHTLRSTPDERELPPVPNAGASQSFAEQERTYDSDDASIDERENVTSRLENVQLEDEPRYSEEDSREWAENGLRWGQGYVDMNALPVRGILKGKLKHDWECIPRTSYNELLSRSFTIANNRTRARSAECTLDTAEVEFYRHLSASY